MKREYGILWTAILAFSLYNVVVTKKFLCIYINEMTLVNTKFIFNIQYSNSVIHWHIPRNIPHFNLLIRWGGWETRNIHL